MAKFQVTVEAHQWFKNGDHPDDYRDDMIDVDGKVITGAERKAAGWEGGVVRYFRDPLIPGDHVCEDCGRTMHDHGWIDEECDAVICPGDWVITDKLGNHYVCDWQTFNALYEPLDD